MSTVNLGKIAPFPPLPGQPYPPARNHPRWKELYRLNDEWMMKYWPFSSEKKRQRIPFMNLTGFSTWCAPAADFDRMVWGGIMASIFFLADDYVDSGRMFERIEGFKAAATGNGPLHPEDRAELCHDIVFRGIKATSHPRTFDQLTKCTHEWWDSNIHEPFKNLDQYLAVRRVNIAMYFANSYFRYTLDINLTDEQVNHPLMREAEGIVSDHVGLTNDFFSYAKEKLTQSDDTNILRILQDHEGLTFEEAKKVVEEKIREKERAYIPAGMAVLNHPELGKDPEVRRWIACLPYCMGGNMAWSQESGRYNIGDVPGGVPFPKLEYFPEPTPEDEIVDDTEETRRRDLVFNVEKEPEVDLALDIDEIESSAVQTKCASEIIVSNLIELPTPARPEHVGIIAIEPYIPGSTGTPHPAPVNSSDEVLESVKSIAWMTVSSMLKRFDIKHHQIGRVDVAVEASARSAKYVTDWLINTFRGYGNVDLEGSVVPNAQNGAVTAFTNACSWIESTAWDGRYALLYLGNFQGGTAVLLGPDAPLVLEPVRGNYFISTGVADPQKDYIGALQAAFDSYHWKRYNKVSQSVLGHTFVTDSATTFHGIDYLVYASSSDDVARVAHQNLFEKTHVSASRKAPTPVGADKDYEHRVNPSLSIVKTTGLDTLFSRVASIIDNVPSYDFFEKRVGLFDYGTRTGGTFLVLQVRGDTKYIRDKMDLANRLQAVTATSPAPLSPAQTPVGASPPSFKFEIQLTGGQQVIGAKVVPVA